MECDHFRQRFCEWLDGDLPPIERHDCDAHARACPACGGLAASCRAVIDTYRRQPPAPLPTGAHQRVMERLGLQPSGRGPNLTS